MRIEVRGQNVAHSPALWAYAERRLSIALRRVEKRVPLVMVRFVDDNGDKGGVDKHCRIEVPMPRSRVVMVDEQHPDLYTAIDFAADRTARAVEREIGRRRAKRAEAVEFRKAEKSRIAAAHTQA
jgi:ribosomal subunit interface protein